MTVAMKRLVLVCGGLASLGAVAFLVSTIISSSHDDDVVSSAAHSNAPLDQDHEALSSSAVTNIPLFHFITAAAMSHSWSFKIGVIALAVVLVAGFIVAGVYAKTTPEPEADLNPLPPKDPETNEAPQVENEHRLSKQAGSAVIGVSSSIMMIAMLLFIYQLLHGSFDDAHVKVIMSASLFVFLLGLGGLIAGSLLAPAFAWFGLFLGAGALLISIAVYMVFDQGGIGALSRMSWITTGALAATGVLFTVFWIFATVYFPSFI